MGIDELLELIGIRPRSAPAKTDAEGVYVQSNAEREQQREEAVQRFNDPGPAPASSLMESVNRVQSGNTSPVNPAYANIDASLQNDSVAFNRAAQSTQASIADEERRLRDLEATMAQAAEQRQRQQAMTPEMVTGPVRGTIPQPPRPPQPAPQIATADPFADMYAHLDRAGPPLQPATQPAPEPIPARPGPPPVNIASQPPPYVNASAGARMPGFMPAQTAVNGAFQTMPPADPFYSPDQPPTPAPIPHPAPDPNYNLPRQSPFIAPDVNQTFPFHSPSAVMRLAGLTEGQRPANEPFAPAGAVIDWWNSNRGQAPTSAQRPRVSSPQPTPAPSGPDQSTILNQQELERFLASNPTPVNTPPAAQSQPQPLASAPPTTPTPPPQGATPMTPAAPPAPGNQIPPALQEQLLQEAYRIVGNRQPIRLGQP